MTWIRVAVALLFTVVVKAQGQLPIPPDCILNFFTNTIAGSATVVSGVFDNRTNACQTWTVDYQASNTGGSISALSLTFQSANGAVSAGTFGSYAGATESGSNPATSTTGSVSTFSNGTTVISWVRMSLTLTATGTTTVKGILYGYKTGYPSGGGGGGGSGCPGTIMTPCQTGVDNAGTTEPTAGDSAGDTYVVGPTAAGSALSKNPVSIGASDGTDVRAVLSDVNGRILNGAYPTTAAPSGSTSGLVQVIAASSGKTTTISHLDVLYASGATFQLEYGTGINCGTGTTAITAQYPSTFLGVAIDVPFVVPASQAVCYNIGSSITWGGFLVYSQP
jgi:hypothetical protein